MRVGCGELYCKNVSWEGRCRENKNHFSFEVPSFESLLHFEIFLFSFLNKKNTKFSVI